MKIAFFTDTFLPQVNGVATSLAIFSREMGKQGHKIVIFAPKLRIKRKKFHAKNVKIIELPSIPAKIYTEYYLSVFSFPIIGKILKTFDPDILHTHTPLTVGFNALIASRVFHKPLVGTCHSDFTRDEYLFFKNKAIRKAVYKVALPIFKGYFDTCDARIAPSNNLINDLKKFGYRKKIYYLPNPLPPEIFKQKSSKKAPALRKKLHLSSPCYIYFGRVSAEKRIDIVIKSFALVKKRIPQATLLIIGNGPSMNECKKLVAELCISKSVVFTGFVAYQDLLQKGYLYVGDIFVSASPMEVRSMSVLEAMAAGLTVIGVKKAGMIELVKKNGVLVPENNINEFAAAMYDIANDKQKMMRMGEESRKKAQEYAVENIVPSLISLYRKTIKQYKKRKNTLFTSLKGIPLVTKIK